MPVVTIHHPIVRECLYAQLLHAIPLDKAIVPLVRTHSPIVARKLSPGDPPLDLSFLSNSRAFDVMFSTIAAVQLTSAGVPTD